MNLKSNLQADREKRSCNKSLGANYRPNIFDDYAIYYEALYQDKDYYGESRFVFSLLEKFGVQIMDHHRGLIKAAGLQF